MNPDGALHSRIRACQWLLLLAGLITVAVSQAQALEVTRLARAPVDEAYYGIGDPRNRWFATPEDPALPQALLAGARGKRNGGYVWAMTAVGDQLWFGTNNNGWCGWLMVSGMMEPGENSHWTCETYRSAFMKQKDARGNPLYPAVAPPVQADWRPPGIYRFDTRSERLVQATSDDPRFAELIGRSYGFRAAGNHQGVVFMAATPIGLAQAGIHLFAFDNASGKLVDTAVLQGYLNVREMRVLEHPDGSSALYLLAGPEIFPGKSANHLLRWRGTAAAPFSGGSPRTPGFEIVGNLESVGIGVSLLPFQGRLLLSTWASTQQPAGIFATKIPASGFSAAAQASFVKLVDATQLDSDPIIARTWLLSPMAAQGKWFYWGTMHPTGTGYQALVKAYPELQGARQAILKAHRRAGLYRSRFGTDGRLETELLYGEARLWTYAPLPDGKFAWKEKPSPLGLRPRHGESGFGETFLDYVWTMTPWRGDLYLGAFDVSGGVRTLLEENPDATKDSVLAIIGAEAPADRLHPGFDLYRIDGRNGKARAVTRDGFGNPASNGVRNMAVIGDRLYLGTTSYSNLDERQGGWEILRLSPAGRKP